MSRLTVPVGQVDHAQGPADAPVSLVEYGDYECPHCGAAYPLVKAVQAAMGRKLRFVFRNFPLAQAHPHAMIAAQAAEAAGLQSEEHFWRMHDWLFENQTRLDERSLVRQAKDLGLDLARFERDMAVEPVISRVKRDFQGGVRSGVNGTPTFFINGSRHDGDHDEESLTAAILEASR